jgi:hypothetical protein
MRLAASPFDKSERSSMPESLACLLTHSIGAISKAALRQSANLLFQTASHSVGRDAAVRL